MDYPIYIDPQVAAMLGPAFTVLARRPAQPTYKCAGYDHQGRFAEPSVVVLLTGPDMAPTIRYAHRACSTSTIRPGSPRSLDEPGDTHAAAGLLPGAAGVRAVLVVETVLRAAMLAGPGDRVELTMSVLQDLGLRLIPSLIAAVPPVPGWQLEFPGPDQARVLAADGTIIYDGALPQPPGWHAIVTRTGRVDLLSGIIGWKAAEQAGPDAQLQALADAARAGMLAGSEIAVIGRSATFEERSLPELQISTGLPHWESELT
jgi:hypothetical protein